MLNFIRSVLKGKSEKEYRLEQGLIVGKNTTIYSWEGLDGNYPWLISIGNNTTISSNVTILAHDASTCKVGCHTKLGIVSIGDNCFIGAKSTVLCDVRIGDNVIVGAGSVVTHDLESGYVYAGSPARKICSFDEYLEKYKKLNDTRPNFSEIHTWNEWKTASTEEKQQMKDALSDGCGFI